MPNTGNTQQQINYGASANDGQGDPLRTAFIKTDDNFDNVWLAGPVGSNITIGNNTIQSNNTNGNIILKPNGVGVIQANASVVPNTDNVRDLGSSTSAWRRAYINELFPDSLTVSGDAVIGGNLTVQGDTIQIGNITTDTLTVQLANTAANATAATGAGITVGASDNIATILYNSTANRWNVSVGLSSVGNISAPFFSGNGSLLTGVVGNYGNANVVANLAALGSNPVSTTGNVTAAFFSGNGSLLTGIASYANANVAAYAESGWAGNIIPSANAVYSLGNSSLYWSNLWVANNTIYIGGVPLGMTAGNVLTVDGNAVLSNNSNTTVSTTGNITAGNVLTGGRVSAAGNVTGGNILTGGLISATGNITANYFLGNIQSTEGNIFGLDSFNFTVENISARIANNGVNIGAGGFNNLVVLPTDVLIQNVPLTVAGNLVANQANGLYITANAPANGTAQIWNFGTDGRLTFPGTPRIDTDSNNFEVQAAENISLEANAVVNIYTDTSGSAYQWQFGDDGTLTTPGDITVAGDITGTAAANTLVLKAQPASNTYIQLNSIVDSVISTVANLEIRTDVSNTARTWEFDTTGNFTAPGNITANYFLGNGSQLTDVNAVTVDVTDTNGLTTIYYPTFVENRANAQIVRADVDFTYRTDDNALTVGTLVTTPVPLANLTVVSGARAFASDGNLVAAGNFGANVAGGGGNVVPVWSDGSNWYIG